MRGLPSSSTSRAITYLPCEDISVRHISCARIVEDTALRIASAGPRELPLAYAITLPSRSHHAGGLPSGCVRGNEPTPAEEGRRSRKVKRKVKVPSRVTSGPNSIVCPACGRGELLGTRGLDLAECDSCGRTVEGAVLRTLEQIVALPDALGEHACECGHPEMRRLPDGVFHCPACGSEVVLLEAGAARTTLVGNPQK